MHYILVCAVFGIDVMLNTFYIAGHVPFLLILLSISFSISIIGPPCLLSQHRTSNEANAFLLSKLRLTLIAADSCNPKESRYLLNNCTSAIPLNDSRFSSFIARESPNRLSNSEYEVMGI